MALIDSIDNKGVANRDAVIANFCGFYVERIKLGLEAEKPRERNPSPLLKPDETSDEQIWNIIARYPLPLMEDYVSHENDTIRIRPTIWSQMSASDLVEIREIAQQRLEVYYD